ncbi:endonuclease MutS2 [bacterium]|nr:endonuclease MutS2 [bacterium]
MDQHTLNILEFKNIQELIIDCSASELADKKIAGLFPIDNEQALARRFDRTKEMVELLNFKPNIPGYGAPDITDILEGLQIEGTILDTQGCIRLWRFLKSSRHLCGYINKVDLPITALKNLAETVPHPNKLEKAFSFVFTEDGKIKDTASKRLKSIRSDIRSIRGSIMNKLHCIIEKKRGAETLYNDQVTIREGRYVLFVKSEKRSGIEGVIHDKSISGATCFIEPSSVIENGNKLRALKFDERNEIRRIKKFLSNMAREYFRELSAMLDPTSELELLISVSKFAKKYKLRIPQISYEQKLSIIDGYHPLLLARIGKQTVPFSIDISPDHHTTIITGPNMGGKTVALKAVGILCVMAQCGLPVPVKSSSCFPVYKNIFADIGDEQSIENDTSTFSSHITRLKFILDKSAGNALVLLDEFGTGTDPEEGASLAIAVLEHLISKKMFVIANTHLFRLKQFAVSKDGVRNASMLFDEQTNLPKYSLVMDIPGSSNAIETAKNLGLPKKIINRARSLMGKSSDEVTALTRKLHQERIHLMEETQKCEQDRKTFNILMKRYKDKLLNFEEDKNQLLRKKLAEAEEFVKNIKKEFEIEVENLKNYDDNMLKQARKKFESFHHDIKHRQNKIIEENFLDDDDLVDEASEKPVKKSYQLEIGDKVSIAPFEFEGKIIDINKKKKRAMVLSDNRSIEADLKNLSYLADEADKVETGKSKQKPQMTFSIGMSNRNAFNPALDLRGKYVEDAIIMLQQHISDVFVYGFKSFSVIHGFGTGRMKKAVVEFLKNHPQIKKFRDGRKEEGGLGVTVVEVR